MPPVRPAATAALFHDVKQSTVAHHCGALQLPLLSRTFYRYKETDVGHKQKKLPTEARQPKGEAPTLELKLEDDDGEMLRRLGPQAPVKGGYNPYDRDPQRRTKPEAVSHANTDLRKLSEWIRLKREVEELKKQDEAQEPKK
jgi:hypothetical protein